MFRIGVDVGGTKIEAAAFSVDGACAARERIATPRAYRDLLQAIAALVGRVKAPLDGPASIGVGHPGSISPQTGRIRNANSTWLNDQAFDRDLESVLGQGVRLANDADCFALSEAVDGAGAGERIVFGVILGTGVGGGVVVDGRLLDGAQRIAGEWGHNPLPWLREEEFPGSQCWCGRRGCIETWLSGPGFALAHEARTKQKLTAEEIFAGDSPDLQSSVADYVDRLARALASVLNVIDANVVILGGGVSNAPDLPSSVQDKLGDYLFSDVTRTRVLRHRHGDSSGVRGAAWLWPAEGA
jgi:fructokinase